MRSKSALLRQIAATAKLWGVDNAWVVADGTTRIVLPNQDGSAWLVVTLEGTAPAAVTGQFRIQDFADALFALRGNVDLLLTPENLTIETKIVLLTPSTITVPSILAEHTIRIDGHAWTTFFEKASRYAWKPESEQWNGILVDGTGTTTALVACDGFRLFQYDTGIPGNTIRAMLPALLCETWQTLEPFDISFSREYALFTAPGELLIGRIRPAVFPDYQPLLVPGDKSVTVKREDLAFLAECKANTVETSIKESSIYLEWWGPWGEPALSGDKKIPALSTVTGKEIFTRKSLLPLLDVGENITVTTQGIKKPYRTTIGGLVYVFKGSD